MKSISTHILDTGSGRPAANVKIELEFLDASFKQVASSETNSDGRVAPGWLAEFKAGTYRIRFHIGDYFKARNEPCFYPYVEIVFEVKDATQHYHVPLLVSSYGYSTYRGS
ncbi:MAG: hydroxyisourate hydrolase [Leptospirales bacterium]|nr:hydroxyisourate hydrolase [Leptospirales bacterium]